MFLKAYTSHVWEDKLKIWLRLVNCLSINCPLVLVSGMLLNMFLDFVTNLLFKINEHVDGISLPSEPTGRFEFL